MYFLFEFIGDLLKMHTPIIDSEDCLEWSTHAVERKNERNIDLDITKLSKKQVLALPYYFSQGCYHFQDTKKMVTYYIRKDTVDKQMKVVTVVSRHPISMLREMCFIYNKEFNTICRKNLFGTCEYGDKCKYVHWNF